MALRIKLLFTIDNKTSMRTKMDLISLMELMEASQFLKELPRHSDCLKKLASGRGVDHEQIRECSTDEFREEIIAAAEKAGFPRGDMNDVRKAMRQLGELFEEEMLVDQWATLMFRKYAHHGGMNTEKKS